MDGWRWGFYVGLINFLERTMKAILTVNII